MKSAVVFCGSSEGNDQLIIDEAYELGKKLADSDITLVYGAAKIGVMGQVAKGALDHHGKVIGVIPEFLKMKEVVYHGLTELHTTQNMHERKLKTHEFSDAIITLPGGFGTLEEFFEMITWAQLGLHGKPIGILNTNGFYNELLVFLEKMVKTGFLKMENYEMILVAKSIDDLLIKMKAYKPKTVPKWIKKDQV